MVELLQPKPPIVGEASITQRKTPVVIDDNKKEEGTSEAIVLCLECDYKCHQQQCSPQWACDKQVQGSPHTNFFETAFSEHQLVAGTPMQHSGFGPPISHGDTKPKVTWYTAIRNKFLHPRVASIGWKLALNCAATDSIAQKRGARLGSRCYVCLCRCEDLNHWLWDCLLQETYGTGLQKSSSLETTSTIYKRP
ncbi:hypothetical protein IFM89_019553 [Coptis chinensis]|uniref:Reverse transcriptase zinc-binding domain-containing protein n=1 Tax=Coptis chinensis TaxID=261450 RepID=A0A835I3M3_9MAGN|nr:hypothetical protein IFM89_019553 [Coptis chinensis]